MAPIHIDLQAWEAANLPGMALLSAVILFVLAITLLALCTSCQRQSFSLDKSVTADRNTPTVVQVVKPETPQRTPLQKVISLCCPRTYSSAPINSSKPGGVTH